jgi:predicted glycosyltransferase
MSPRIFSYTQHLEGIGHLVRSLRLAVGFDRAGFKVELVMGGVPVEGLDTGGIAVTRLPPLKAGPGGFSDLRDENGAEVGDDYKARRREQLLVRFERVKPNVLVIEAFPFGRRQMRFELLPLLDMAAAQSPRPLIACSVRDILQENKQPDRIEDTVRCLQDYFDLVLVHGDPAFASLDLTFPGTRSISNLIRYTGIVAGHEPEPVAHEFKVLVSVGGGATGAAMLDCAARARGKTRFAGDPWCLITGPYLPDDAARLLKQTAGRGVTVQRFRKDLAGMMATATVSVSRSGYNTGVDIFQSGCRAVVVPHAKDGETEQTRRAQLMAENGFAIMVDESGLDADVLARAIDQAADLEQPPPPPALDGVANTVEIVTAALKAGNG